VLFSLDHGEAFGADLMFDGSVINNTWDSPNKSRICENSLTT
jgi:hypothetical protein